MSTPEQREARIADARRREDIYAPCQHYKATACIACYQERAVAFVDDFAAWLIAEVECIPALETKNAEKDAEIARLAELAWPRPLDADRMLALHRANTAPAVSDKAAWLAAHRDELEPVTVSSPEPSRDVEEQPVPFRASTVSTSLTDRCPDESVPAASVSAERAALIAELEKGSLLYENEVLYTIDGHPRTFKILASTLRKAVAALRGEA